LELKDLAEVPIKNPSVNQPGRSVGFTKNHILREMPSKTKNPQGEILCLAVKIFHILT